MKIYSLALGLILLGCANQVGVSPAQQTLNTTGESCKQVGNALDGLDQLVLAKGISKANAEAAYKGLSAAQTGCVAALGALQAAAASASGAGK